MKKAIILSKNPAFDVISCSSVETALLLASYTVTVNVVSPLDEGEIVQVVPSSETSYEKLPFDAVHSIRQLFYLLQVEPGVISATKSSKKQNSDLLLGLSEFFCAVLLMFL